MSDYHASKYAAAIRQSSIAVMLDTAVTPLYDPQPGGKYSDEEHTRRRRTASIGHAARQQRAIDRFREVMTRLGGDLSAHDLAPYVNMTHQATLRRLNWLTEQRYCVRGDDKPSGGSNPRKAFRWINGM